MGKSKKNRPGPGFSNNEYIRNFRNGPQKFKPRYQQNTIHRSYFPHSYNYVFGQNQYKVYRNSKFKKVRPLSPAMGSSEHMHKKIEETSAIIMQHLLNPDETMAFSSVNKDNCNSSIQNNQPLQEKVHKKTYFNKAKKKIINKSDKINEKIMNHLSNLTEGRKRNLINSDKSEYDLVIQQIMRQKRLEISRTLRTVFSKTEKSANTNDSSNIVNPDVGIIIEDLPQNLITELRHVLNFDINETDKDTIDSCPDDILLNVLNNFIQNLDSPEFSTLTKIKTEDDLLITNNHNIPDSIIHTEIMTPFYSEIKSENLIQKSSEKYTTNASEKENFKINNLNCFDLNITIKEEQNVEDDTNFIENHNITKYEGNEVKLEPDHSYNLTDQTFVLRLTKDSNHLNNSTSHTTPCVDSLNLSNVKNMNFSQSSDNDSKPKLCNVSIQTETTDRTVSINKFLEVNFKEIPSSFNEAISQMYQIDNWISELTTYRQNIFATLCSLPEENKFKI